MDDVLRSSGTSPHQGQSERLEPPDDQAVENAALLGAAAIQKLVAERNELRTRLATHDQETAACRALNNELRRRLMLVHQTYVEMAKSIVGDLECFDAALRESAQGAHATIEAQRLWEQPARPASARPQNGGAETNGAHVNGAQARVVPRNGAPAKGAAQIKP